MAQDVKELKKDVELLKNTQGNIKTDLRTYLQTSIDNINQKVEVRTKEQKEYIASLHQDIDEAIKRAKRDKSDNYLEINKLSTKVFLIYFLI